MDLGTLGDVSRTQQSTQDERVIKNDSQQLGREDFMQLLMAEMKYQDPLNPMDNKDSIAQLAQFNSLSQMESLNSNFMDFVESQKTSDMSAGVQFIGKNVTAIIEDEKVTGEITGINSDDGELFLKMKTQVKDEDGNLKMAEVPISLNDIRDVDGNSGMSGSNSIATGAQFIGKMIGTSQGVGEVVSASLKDNKLMLNMVTPEEEMVSVPMEEVMQVTNL
ncbi:MAG: flagellar hook assembly protein FlgD [Fusobacteriota bacterium]